MNLSYLEKWRKKNDLEVFYGLLFDGNITVESEGNSFEQTFKNPFLQGFKCDLCDLTAKSERGLKAH